MGSLTANAPLPNIQKKPRILGVLGTILFWALFVLFGTYFSLFSRKPVYKTVQIRLDSPQTKTQEARAAAAPKSTEKSVEPAQALPPPPAPQTAPAQPTAQTTPVQTPPPQNKPAQTKPAPAQKTQPAQTKNAPAQKAPPAPAKPAQSKPQQKQTAQPPAKPAPAPKKVEDKPFVPEYFDPMEQLNRNISKKSENKTANTIDWAKVDANTTSTATNAPSQVTAVDELSGSAGTASSKNKPVSASSTQSKTSSTAASTGTTNALRDIAATSYSKVSGNGVSSVATVKTGGTTDGKVAVQMTDGTARTLLDPATPSISLSTAAAALIDGKKEVTIRFSVTASGTVPVSGIQIIPSILHPIVRDEVTAQISRWRFSSADTAGNAVLEYTINVK